MKEETKSLYALTLKEVEQFDLDQCTEYIHLLDEKCSKWKRLEEALYTRREKIVSEHTTDEEGGWFQEKEGVGFCRIWKRGMISYCNRECYYIIKLQKYAKVLSSLRAGSHVVLKPLDGGEPILVKMEEAGSCVPYKIVVDDQRINKNHVRDHDTFYDKWEKTTPLILVVK